MLAMSCHIEKGLNLKMTSDPHPWASNLPYLYTQVWTRLSRGVADKKAPARHPTLATVGADGRPHTRTIVLRSANTATHCLEFHTDLRSAKIDDLRHAPFAAVHIWDTSAHLQIRIEGLITILQGDDVAFTWARVPQASRSTYCVMLAPGQPITDALAYQKGDDYAHFGVLRMNVESIDVLHLGPNHRRARFDKSSDWTGKWLVP
jgi:pyridoxamine 5'-phosphate oxidase